MIAEEIKPVHDAMDKSFRFAGDQWSKDFHMTLELPGIFKELLQNDTVKDPKTGMRMDLLELVELEGGIEILINIEHQSTVLDTVKIKIIDRYKNHSKCKHKLPLLSVIVSPFPKEQHENEYHSTESDILKPIFITIDEKEIKKRLNILKNNIQNKNIENSIVLNIAIISIFVLENKYEILKELCKILKEAKGLTGKIKNDMAKILEEMIKYKLKYDENQVIELLNMLKEERETARRGMKIWYEEEFEKIEVQHQNEIRLKDSEINLNKAQFQKQLAEKENELAEKENELAELRAKLKSNGIT